LIAVIGTWYVEAGKYDVMLIDGSGLARMVGEKPLIALPRDSYTYLPDTQSVPNSRRQRCSTVGMRYVHNYVGRQLLGVESDKLVPAGKHELRFEFEPTGEPDMPNGKGAPGRMQLLRRPRLGRQRRRRCHDAVHVQPRCADLRSQPGLPGRT
jgi:hypothetical protein